MIFLHIPKTGGSTLRRALARHVPPVAVYSAAVEESGEQARRYLEGEIEIPDADPNEQHLRGLSQLSPEAAERLRLYLGHFWFGVDERLPAPSTYVTIVREPVDRLLSLHHHRVVRHHLGQTLAEWVGRARDAEMFDAQTRRLAGSGRAHRAGPCTQTMLDVAEEHLATRFAGVGVTERFEESAIALARGLGWPPLGWRWVNRSDGRAPRTEVAADIVEILRERNRFDAELHRFAGECLDAALAGVDVERERRRLHRANRLEWGRRRIERARYRARFAAARVKRAVVRSG